MRNLIIKQNTLCKYKLKNVWISLLPSPAKKIFFLKIFFSSQKHSLKILSSLVIGSKGATINKFMAQSKVRIQIEENFYPNGDARARITGSEEGVTEVISPPPFLLPS